ncbi:MAG TPA: hypothetical protein VGX23_05615 [Actinocrinis sp.]|nr:hypothetical protein [Actinocrinis sp.]
MSLYPDKRVWLVVDLCDNTIVHGGVDLDEFAAVLGDSLRAKLVKTAETGGKVNLLGASAFFPRELRSFRSDLWS